MHVLFDYSNPDARHGHAVINHIGISSPEINNTKQVIFDDKATAVLLHLNLHHDGARRLQKTIHARYPKTGLHADNKDEVTLRIPSITPHEICDRLIHDGYMTLHFYNSIRENHPDGMRGDVGSEEDYEMSW